MVLVIDGSESVQAENFEKMRQFAINVVQLAEIETGAVRIGVLQYTTFMWDQFFMNDFLEEIGGKQVQNKTKLLEVLETMPYQEGRTNTGGAIKEARVTYFSEDKGARPGVPKHMLVITDGEANEGPDPITEAGISIDQGIHMFAVGIDMKSESARAEVNGIASEPTHLNVLNIDTFDQLEDIFTKIFLWFCRSEYIRNACTYTYIRNISTVGLFNSQVCEVHLSAFGTGA